MELFSKFFKSDSPIRKVLIDVLFESSKSSSFVLIPLSEINGPLWLTKTSWISKVVLISVFKVFKFLLLMPINASLNFKLCLASSTVCTSTIIDILNFNASSYSSFARLSLTPANIINIASAPWLFANGIWNLSIKKSLQRIGNWIFCFILLMCIRFPKKKSSSVKTDKQVALFELYIFAISIGS